MNYLPLLFFLLPFLAYTQSEEDVLYLGGGLFASLNFQDNSFFKHPDALAVRGAYFITPRLLVGADVTAGLELGGRYLSDNTFTLSPFARLYFLGDLDRAFRLFAGISAFTVTQRQVDLRFGGHAGAEWRVRPGIVGTLSAAYSDDLRNDDATELDLRAGFNALLNRRNGAPPAYRGPLRVGWMIAPQVARFQRFAAPGNASAKLFDLNLQAGLVLDRFLVEGRLANSYTRFLSAEPELSAPAESVSVAELGGRYLPTIGQSSFAPYLGAKFAYSHLRSGADYTYHALDLVIQGGTFLFLNRHLALDASLQYRNGILSSPLTTRFGARIGLKLFLGSSQP